MTNSSDRTLRQFNVPVYATSAAEGEYIEQELEPTYRFNDPINKNAWHAMAYSPDGEWLAGGQSPSILRYPVTNVPLGAADNAAHKIYIWDLANEGQFATALDGGPEPLLHVHVRDFCVLPSFHRELMVASSGIRRKPRSSRPRTLETSWYGIAPLLSDGAPLPAASRKSMKT